MMKTATRLAIPLLALLIGLAACTQDPNVRKQRYLERGVKYLAEGKQNEAIIELKNALQIDPKFVPALEAIGRAYLAKAWYGDALRELQRAVEITPDSVTARVALGQVYLELGAWDQAEATGEQIRGKDPRSAFGPYLVGAARTGGGRARDGLPRL